jgi:thioredoxin reductase (NADPH)
MSEVRDVIVIGSGPAGYATARCTARADLNALGFRGAVFVGHR